LALARLRANRMLSELRVVDLRFSKQEAEVFLTQTVGVDTSTRIAAPLWERVEGWIAGLQLASLPIRAAPNAIELAQQLIRGHNRYIMDYLFEQVLQRQSPPMQQFLMKTSILDRLSPALAQAVMAEDALPSSPIDLAALERAGLFLTALDETGEWFQCHALFRELLYRTLQHTHAPEEIAELHRRASLWFRQNGLVEEALRHALPGGGEDLAAQIVAEQVAVQLNRFDWHPLERWLAQLPASVVETHPWLLAAEAYVLHFRSQWGAMLPVVKRAEQRLNAPDRTLDSSERAVLRGYLDTLWSVHWISLDEAELAKEASQKAIHNLPPTHSGVREVTLFPLCCALHSLGDYATAERILDEMLAQEPLLRSDRPAAVGPLFALVGVHMAEGYVFKLEQAAWALRQISVEANVPLMQVWAHLALGEAAYESNDLSRAAEHFAAGAALRSAGAARAVQECLIGATLVEQARGHGDAAKRAVANLLDYHRELANPVLTAEGDSLQARLALMDGDLDAARRWSDSARLDLAWWWPLWMEIPAITHIRVGLADRSRANLEGTRQELDALLELATRLHKPRRMVELLTLKALLLDRSGERKEALQALVAALALGEPRGLVRAIADAGPPLEPLLKEVARRASSHYLDRILAALHPTTASAASLQSGPRPTAKPIALLTNREQDVLMLLGRRYTDREIAEALVISPLTVRSHIENLSE
jgi:LuxR family maltose regulon positive regulatory protein